MVLLVILALIVIIFLLVQSDPPVVRSPKPSSPVERTNWLGPSQITGYSRSHSPLVNKPATMSAKNLLFARLVNEGRQAQEKQRRVRRGHSHEGGRLEHAPKSPRQGFIHPCNQLGSGIESFRLCQDCYQIMLTSTTRTTNYLMLCTPTKRKKTRPS